MAMLQSGIRLAHQKTSALVSRLINAARSSSSPASASSSNISTTRKCFTESGHELKYEEPAGDMMDILFGAAAVVGLLAFRDYTPHCLHVLPVPTRGWGQEKAKNTSGEAMHVSGKTSLDSVLELF
ncbi:uncharacterized protein LOC112269533 [Brachypodium distachyon]|uniref:Uncharacterized protein n=1 Tax=Brachypodium distachyon TaxID=15368 RepID=A0A2K2CF83_BRADI|nr:uncharacterized protein LOC112269533 [Brachypodium distachyon]PNT60680.1 hypothetical protein BRADI_5g03244v3 [Brachypodium distachyon]|eukprot:XP_024312198.1 uncharacterized protein LOC112269533 [Brachypodium distachyon]